MAKKDRKKIFGAYAIISQIKTMADGSLRVQVDCQEMSPEHEAIIFANRNTHGYFIYANADIPPTQKEVDNLDLPAFVTKEPTEKTPSKRLRNVLYLLWKKRGEKDLYGRPCTSDEFYVQILEKVINAYKDKL